MLTAIIIPLAIAARLSFLFLEQKGSRTPTTQQMGNSQPIYSRSCKHTSILLSAQLSRIW
jgi:hypothetical protein